MNVPPIIAAVLSIDASLIGVLNRVSVRDLHDLLEVRAVDAHNRRIVGKATRNSPEED